MTRTKDLYQEMTPPINPLVLQQAEQIRQQWEEHELLIFNLHHAGISEDNHFQNLQNQ